MDFAVFIESENAKSERRLNSLWSISTLRDKLYTTTGIPPAYQILPFSFTSEPQLLSTLYIEPLSTLVIKDSRPPQLRPNYTDTSNVTKFELSAEEYERRNDSVLAFKKRNGLGRFSHQEQEEEPVPENIVVGARCKVGDRLGTVQYVGLVPEIPSGGTWIGIKYDEPVGKNNGTIGGKTYFQAGQKYGGFCRAGTVTIGDFEEEDFEEI